LPESGHPGLDLTPGRKSFQEGEVRKLLIVAVLLVGVLSGCASPKVVYNQVEKDEKDFDGKIRFQLTDTIIKFDYQKDSKSTSNPDKTQLSVTPTALNDTRATYAIEGVPWYKFYKTWFNSTDLTATHADGNPLLLTQLGTSMTDQAIPVLKALGTIVAGAVAMGAGGTSTPKPATIPLPVGIKISEFLASISGDLRNNCNWDDKNNRLPEVDRDAKIICKDLSLVLTQSFDSVDNSDEAKDVSKEILAGITIDPVPSGALLVDRKQIDPVTQKLVIAEQHPNKKPDITFPFESKAMIFSACRPMHITLKLQQTPKKKNQNDPDLKPIVSPILDTTLFVADSDWVQTIALPSKGSVKFSSSCGADSIPSDFTQKTILDDFSQAVSRTKVIPHPRDHGNSPLLPEWVVR
jgi:hypothetical protein